MAGTLDITNGTDTVSLLDVLALYLKSKGNRIIPGQRDQFLGEVERVTDVYECSWAETDVDDRADTLITLGLLKVQAQENDPDKLPGSQVGDPVWLTRQTHNETNPLYFIVHDIIINELSTREWGAAGPVDLVLTIVRDGDGRKVAPNAAVTSFVTSTTLTNSGNASPDPSVDITVAETPGDLATLSEIKIEGTSVWSGSNDLNFLLWTQSDDDSTELDKFDPLLAPGDNDSGHSDAAISNAMGGRYIALNALAGANQDIYWDRANLSKYVGDYQIWAAFTSAVTDGHRARFWHGDEGYPKGPWVVMDNYGTHPRAYYLGNFRIPNGAYNSGLGDPSTYRFAVEMDWVIGGQFNFYGAWMVKTTYGSYGVEDMKYTTPNKLVLDGVRQQTYFESSSGAFVTGGDSFRPVGRYIRFKPGKRTRLWAFHRRASNNDVDFNDTFALTVGGVPRFSGLRGSN